MAKKGGGHKTVLSLGADASVCDADVMWERASAMPAASESGRLACQAPAEKFLAQRRATKTPFFTVQAKIQLNIVYFR